jgi:predicted SnoaL-like aldol condensation-catalyzing enzyme
MSTQENKKIAEQDVLCVGPATLEKKLTFYTEDAVVWDSVIWVMQYAPGNTVKGITEVKEFFTWLANMPPVEAKIQSVFGEGDMVAVEWMLGGQGPSGAFTIPCVNIYEFKNGKIKRVQMQFDSAGFAEIIGKFKH